MQVNNKFIGVKVKHVKLNFLKMKRYKRKILPF